MAGPVTNRFRRRTEQVQERVLGLARYLTGHTNEANHIGAALAFVHALLHGLQLHAVGQIVRVTATYSI